MTYTINPKYKLVEQGPLSQVEGMSVSSNCISKDRYRLKEYLERSSNIQEPWVRYTIRNTYSVVSRLIQTKVLWSCNRNCILKDRYLRNTYRVVSGLLLKYYWGTRSSRSSCIYMIHTDEYRYCITVDWYLRIQYTLID